MADFTESEMTEALIMYYRKLSGNGPRFVVAAQVRSHAGFDAKRTADFLALDLWPSQGLDLHGHEIKTNRGDWLRELKHPEKAQEFIPYLNRWWIVAPEYPLVVSPLELPEGYGLIYVSGMRHRAYARVVRSAVYHEAASFTLSRMAAFARAVAVTAARHPSFYLPGWWELEAPRHVPVETVTDTGEYL